MLIAAFPAGPWQTNCYVVAPASGEECLIIDPGMDASRGVASIVEEYRLRPAAILLTHGHIDHMLSVTPVAGAYDAIAYIHPNDRAMLTDPFSGISPESAAMALGIDPGLGVGLAEPDDVRPLLDAQTITVAGLEIAVDHAPGHTPGSVMFRTPYDEEIDQVMFSGDVLFKGSIGRTDLPGGDHAAMLHSLETKIVPLDDSIVVLPGHGDQTTIGTERRTNPFLRAMRQPAR